MAQKLRPQAETLSGSPQPNFTGYQASSIVAKRAPTSSDTGYPIGQLWVDKILSNSYQLVSVAAGAATWAILGGSSSALATLTGDTGTATPVAGNILIAGGTNLTTAASGSTVTVNMDATLTGLTSVTSDSFVTASATLGTTYTANSITVTGSDANTGLLVSAKGTGAVAQSRALVGGDVAMVSSNTDNTNGASRGGFQAMSGGASGGDAYYQAVIGGVTTWTFGADNSASDAFVLAASATLGTSNAASWSTAGALTNTAGITATTGNITTSASGAGLVMNSPTASGAAPGPVVVNGRSGKATFTGVSIAAAADLTLTITNSAITDANTQVIYSVQGATTGSAVSIKSVTNSAGSSAVVLTNGTGATTTTANIDLIFLVLN